MNMSPLDYLRKQSQQATEQKRPLWTNLCAYRARHGDKAAKGTNLWNSAVKAGLICNCCGQPLPGNPFT